MFYINFLFNSSSSFTVTQSAAVSSVAKKSKMLKCETKSRDHVGIRPDWDQSFLVEDDEQLRRLSDEVLDRLRLRKDVTLINKGRSEQRDAEDGCSRRCYINFPACPNNLVVPQTGSGTVTLKTDLSPMSPRAHTIGTTNVLSSSVAQVALSRLMESGFYYGSMSPTEARRLLQPHPPGTFLVRASSDQRFLFSITLRTSDGVSRHTSTSVRIQLLETGRFRLDGEKPSSHLLPSSPCVLDLLRRHTAERAVGRTEFVLLDGGRETPLVLRRPLNRDTGPATLKHLCRRRIHSVLDGRSVDRLHLVPSLKQYLKEYPSDL